MATAQWKHRLGGTFVDGGMSTTPRYRASMCYTSTGYGISQSRSPLTFSNDGICETRRNLWTKTRHRVSSRMRMTSNGTQKRECTVRGHRRCMPMVGLDKCGNTLQHPASTSESGQSERWKLGNRQKPKSRKSHKSEIDVRKVGNPNNRGSGNP